MHLMQRLARQLLRRRYRNWLRSPAKTTKWVLDELRYQLGLNRLVSIRPGWALSCHPAAYRCAYYAQKDDPAQVKEFNSFITACSPGMRLIDVGAHFGIFSLAALHYGGPEATALAVDPSPTACRMMRIQAQLNRVSDRFQIVEATVGDKVGEQPMVAVGVLADGYFVTPSQAHSSQELTPTQATTIDHLTGATGRPPTHLKIDVEGAEAAVLRGAKQTLSRPDGPLLFIELHNQIVKERKEDPGEVIGLLRNYGYTPLAVDGTPISEETILGSDLIRVRAAKLSSASPPCKSRCYD
jgi:FkbM family methyltransferase